MPLPMFNVSTPSRIQILAVAAGKGGVGKSTVAANLAIALQRKGSSVGLVDMDLYGPSIRKILPEDRLPQQHGEKIQPALARGVKMISLAHFRKEEEASIMRAPIANGIVKQFLNKVEWGPIEYLIVDYPPGTGDIQLTVSQSVPLAGAILVTTPQEVALLDVRKTAHMFSQVKVPVVGVIENMSYYKLTDGSVVHPFGRDGGKHFADEEGVAFLGALPLDGELCVRADRGLNMYDPGGSVETIDAMEHIVTNLEASLSLCRDNVHGIEQLQQVSSSEFIIRWADAVTMRYSAHMLQKQCPCAGCRTRPKESDPGISIQQLVKVGGYALRATFSKGCSHGIYDFAALRKIGERV